MKEVSEEAAKDIILYLTRWAQGMEGSVAAEKYGPLSHSHTHTHTLPYSHQL